jgi:hypothetical protein
MVRPFLLMLALLFASTVSYAADAPAFGLRYEANGTGEQVLILPQDQDKFYFTLIGDPNTLQFQRITDWFDSHAGLKSIKDRTHFNVIDTNSIMYRERYQHTTTGVPTVRLQAANGSVIYQSVGAQVPVTPDLLYFEVDKECLKRWNNCPICPKPQPKPQPKPEPGPEPLPAPPVSEFPPWWFMLLSFVAGSVGGVAAQYAKNYYAEAA